MKEKYTHSLDSYNKGFIKLLGGLTSFLELSLRFSIVGIDHIPTTGRGILIMNHSALPVDGMLLVAEFLKQKGRLIRPLVSQNLRKHSLVRKGVLMWGGVDANASNALKLLEQGELLLVYPGELRETIKGDEQRYKILWGEEYGFVKLALLTGAPVIPVASVGLDENFHLISDGLLINRLLFGKNAYLAPIVRPRYMFPKKVTLYAGKPLSFPYPPEAAKDISTVQKLQQQVKEALETLLSEHVGDSRPASHQVR